MNWTLFNWKNLSFLFDSRTISEIYEEIDELENALELARDEVIELDLELVEIETEVDALKKEVRYLLDLGVIDVLAVKAWYENKYGSRSWFYNFDGNGSRDSKESLKVSPTGAGALKVKANEILSTYNLEATTDPNAIVEAVMKWALDKNTGFKYVTDVNQFGKIEFWQKAEETLKTMKGDCDDLAILMHILVYYAFEKVGLAMHYWRLKLCAGGTLLEGHAFNIWLGDTGEWYAVESTLDLLGSYTKTWLKTPIRNNNLYTSFWGFVRKDRSWAGANSSIIPYQEVKLK